jgi:hypothetical protein
MSNYWGTIHKNFLHFQGSHPQTMNFPTKYGSYLVHIWHFFPFSHLHSCGKAILQAKMWAGTKNSVDLFFAKHKPITVHSEDKNNW